MQRSYFLLYCAALTGLGLVSQNEARADYSTGFEAPTYTAGQSLNGQDGWTATQVAFQFGTGNIYSTANNVIVSNTNPSTGSQAVTTSLVTYDNQGGGYQIAGFLASRAVPTTTTPTLVSFDLRVNNDPTTDPDIVDKAFFLTNANGYVIAGIDFQQDAKDTDNSVGFYTHYDNGGAAYPAMPTPQPHQLTYATSTSAVLTPNAYQTWGIEEVPATSMIHYFLNGVDVYDTPSFQGSSISGITFMMQNQESLSYNETQLGETVNLDNIVVAPPPSVWNLPGSGSWSNASSWALVIPNSVGATASFLGAITSNSTVSVTAPETVGAMIFNNSNSYTIAGSNTITLTATSGAATINVSSGSHTIATPLVFTAGLNITTSADPSTNNPSLTLPLNITATGALTKSGPGTLAFAASSNGITTLSLPTLNISAGTLALTSNPAHNNRTLLMTTSLSVAGKLDLGNSDMDMQAGGTAGLTAITSYLQQGYRAGSWNGSSGIASSAAASNSTHLTTLGVILNNTNGSTPLYGTSGSLGLFDGTSPAATDILIKYTYYGDANLDGKVDGSDYSLIDNGYVSHLTGWRNGDFNYDSVINGSDYTLIDNAFNTQGAQLSAVIAGPSTSIAAQIANTSPVPEPGSLGLLSIAAASLLGRRRHG